ncbi:MAG: hypothetical protein M3Y90_15550 [Actinomycetota bacterium]|nr:hypothetical protein [Actinomycetota bacterium]
MRHADPDVLGYISQCGLCGQRALTRTAHLAVDRFVCPRCREVTGWGDVDVAQAEPDFLPPSKVRG